MSTKYPIAYDDGVTLGGPFLNVSPPVDPQRNIAAEFRNNMNDAMVAVQERIGYLDDPATDTIDWGLLTVSSVPNQGLRFAGSHAQWPGVTGEAGIFINSANNHVSFHKAGDPLGTFIDLTAGYIPPTWDDIYAGDKTLTINGTPLIFTQTSTGGYGFEILRNEALAAAPMVHIENQHSSNPQSALYVQNIQTASIALNSAAKFLSVSAGLTGGSEDLISVKSQVNEDATDIAGAELFAFHADVGGTAGLGTTVGYFATNNFDWGVRSNSPVLIDLDTSALPLPVALVISDTSAAGDTYPFILMDGPVSGGTPRMVVHRNGQTGIFADNDKRALEVSQNDSITGDEAIVQFNDGNLGQQRFELKQLGAILHQPADPTSSFESHAIRTTSGGLGVADIWKGFKVDFTGVVADANPYVYGLDLSFNAGGGSHSKARAINVGGAWNHGLYSLSPIFINSGTIGTYGISLDVQLSNPAIIVGQTGTGKLAEFKSGSTTGGTSCFWIDVGGNTSIETLAASTALIVGQTASAAILELKDGTTAFGNTRVSVSKNGNTWISTQSGSGQNATSIEQYSNDANVLNLFSNQSVLTRASLLVNATTGASGAIWQAWVDGRIVHNTETLQPGNTAYTLNVESGGLAALQTVNGFGATPIGHASDAATSVLSAYKALTPSGSGSATDVGFYAESGYAYGVFSKSTIRADISAVINAAEFVTTAGSVNVDSNASVIINTTNSTGPVLSATQGSVTQNGVNIIAGTFSVGHGLEISANWTYGLYLLSQGYISPPSDTQALDINCTLTDTSGDIPGVTVDMFRSTSLTSAGRDVYGIKTTMYEDPADASSSAAEHAAFRAEFVGTAPTSDSNIRVSGLSITTGFKTGVYSGSPILVESSTPDFLGTVSAFCYTGGSTGVPLLRATKGTFAAGTTRFNVDSEGLTTIFCEATSSYALTVTSNNALANILHLYDDVVNASRLTVALDGRTVLQSDASSGYIFRINTLDAGLGLLQLYDSVNALDRVVVASTGEIDITPNYDVSGQGAVTINNTWSSNADGMVLRLIANGLDLFYVQNDGIARFSGRTDIGTALIEIYQNDQDQGFIDFRGAALAGHSGNISGQQGDGAVVGPKAKNTVSGWTFDKMIKIEINGAEAWVASYLPDDV